MSTNMLSLLSEREIKAIADAYLSGFSLQKVQRKFHRSREAVLAALESEGVEVRAASGGHEDFGAYLPSQEEIRRETSRIQKQWSAEEEQERAVVKRVDWKVPIIGR